MDAWKVYEHVRDDIRRAKAVARKHGFAWNDTETVEGFVANLLAVLLGERQIHAEEIQELRKTVKNVIPILNEHCENLTPFECAWLFEIRDILLRALAGKEKNL